MNALNTMLVDYAGNNFWQLTWFLTAIAVGIIIGKIFYYFCKNQLRKLAEKSKSKFDDLLIDIIEEPIVLLLFTAGFWSGAKFLTLSETGLRLFDNIVFVLIAVVITWFVLRLIDMLAEEYLEPLVEKSESKLDDQILPIVRKSAKGIFLILAIVVVLSNLGYDIISILAGLGVGGLALALAAQDTVKNIIGGFTIFWDKPFQINDYVEIDGESGTVMEVGIRSTRLQTLDGTVVVIPNSTISDTIIENYSTQDRRNIKLSIGLTYDTSADKMESGIEIIRKVIESVEGIDEGNIHIRFTNFGAYSLDLEILYQIINLTNWKMIVHQVNMGVKRELDNAGIEMAFPTETHYVINQSS